MIETGKKHTECVSGKVVHKQVKPLTCVYVCSCYHSVFLHLCVCVQGVSVVEQEQLDNMMIEMDGTENKCESGGDVRTNTASSESRQSAGNAAYSSRVRKISLPKTNKWFKYRANRLMLQTGFGSRLTSLIKKIPTLFIYLNLQPCQLIISGSSWETNGAVRKFISARTGNLSN